jgi:hypothetical protein
MSSASIAIAAATLTSADHRQETATAGAVPSTAIMPGAVNFRIPLSRPVLLWFLPSF